MSIEFEFSNFHLQIDFTLKPPHIHFRIAQTYTNGHKAMNYPSNTSRDHLYASLRLEGKDTSSNFICNEKPPSSNLFSFPFLFPPLLFNIS